MLPSPGPAAVAAARYGFEHVLGESERIVHATALARRAASNDLPVVLIGESGTGKELFAQAIHTSGGRRGGPFIAVNCGSIPAALLEAELFGYEAGTFTGARKEGNAGKFEEAGGGTLFLDEVSELSPQAQAALLRVLQEREVVRLGGSMPRRIDIRVIAASNRELAGEMRAGRFRPDLFFRLNVLTIAVPPLRERPTDVPLLARAFLRDAEGEVGRSGLRFSEEALRALCQYDWPGNIRELRNVVLRLAATVPQSAIEHSDLPEEVRAARTAPPEAPAGPVPVAPRPPPSDPDRDGLRHALEASGWNVARTAASLGVSRMTLYRWLHKHGIEPRGHRGLG
ncbi:MAG TPA: sigma 54-interacting transcriptional regulator [Anaeromyxobacteraceae bacterium]|nr:sigma 54-interacting transcriptional regulator [Anaeromyxobacteraceae bacterium]